MKRGMRLTALAVAAALMLPLLLTGCDASKKPYAAAQALLEQGDYLAAAEAFAALGEYEDAQALHIDSLFAHGKELLEQGEYEQAINVLEGIEAEGSEELIESAKAEIGYLAAVEAFERGDYPLASKLLYAAKDMHDAQAKLDECMYVLRYFEHFVASAGGHETLAIDDGAGQAYLQKKGVNARMDEGVDGFVGGSFDGPLFRSATGELRALDAESRVGRSPTAHSLRDLEVVDTVVRSELISYALAPDGRVFRCPLDEGPAQVEGLPTIARLAYGYNHCAAIDYEGGVWFWEDEIDLPQRADLDDVYQMKLLGTDDGDAVHLFLKYDGTVWQTTKSEDTGNIAQFYSGAEQVGGVQGAQQLATAERAAYALIGGDVFQIYPQKEEGAIVDMGAQGEAVALAAAYNARRDTQGWRVVPYYLTADDRVRRIFEQGGVEDVLVFERADEALQSDYDAAVALGEQGKAKQAYEAFGALGMFTDASLKYLDNLFAYYDEQFNAGEDLSALSVPYVPGSGLYDAYETESVRLDRVERARNAVKAAGLEDYYGKAKASVSPVEVTGRGLYIVNNADTSRVGSSSTMRKKIITTVPIFFLAEKPENIRYLMVIDTSFSRSGKYTDGAAGYTTTVKVALNDTQTGKSLLSKSYKARPPQTKGWGSGDGYGSYNLMDSAYEKDILPALQKLYE